MLVSAHPETICTLVGDRRLSFVEAALMPRKPRQYRDVLLGRRRKTTVWRRAGRKEPLFYGRTLVSVSITIFYRILFSINHSYHGYTDGG
jgi:hypothetical protein